MINTGGTKNIVLYDDINSTNLYEAIKAYNECDLYIDKKFDMPLANQGTKFDVINPSVDNISNKLNQIEHNLNRGISEYSLNITQFRSFKAKIIYWCNTIFNDLLCTLHINKSALVFIDNDKISKHEWVIISWLNELGVDFFIRCNNIQELSGNNVSKHVLNTGLKMDYKSEKVQIHKENRFDSLEKVESALYSDDVTFKLIVSGVDNYMDTCNFYGKIYKESLNSTVYKLYLNGFDKPTLAQISDIPRFNNMTTDYIIQTVPGFLNTNSVDIKKKLEVLIKDRFNKKDLYTLQPSILYNKIVNTVISLNNIFKNNVYKYIILYGKIGNNDKIVLEILSNIKTLGILIITSDKSKAIQIDNMETLELKDSLPIFEIPKVDSRDNARTLAVQASDKVKDILYNDNTLGLYRPGQFNELGVKLFNTTFDEIELWWNKEMHIRPGFESFGKKAVLPTMFKVIKGIKGNKQEYKEYIQKLSCGKTLLCKNIQQLRELSLFKTKYTSDFNGIYMRHLTDINKTSFNNQKPFFEDDRLNRQRIQSCINYKYGFMSGYKQELIIERIETLLNSEFIIKSAYVCTDDFVDNVLNILLNLDMEVLKIIQWFEFYTYNPNVILTLTDEKQLSTENIIMLMFLYLMGFDILIFVPTGYNSIENLVTDSFMYDTHLIGELQYNVDIYNINVTDNIEVKNNENKKQSFFSKLFNN